ncbi:MAG: TonB-dependent receptor, partial [Sedimentisphaerales bacterium]|nr:TonB-dependent receptor [Sedimentisphaerales bacterium]
MRRGRIWLARHVKCGAMLVLTLVTSMPALAQSEPAGSSGGSTAGTSSGEQKAKPSELESLLDMPIDQLAKVEVHAPSMEVEVTTVSRTSQPIARTPAAVYVVTNEMIRRCGARNVPEVLRTVPGVNVARINASTWAISIRGFNGRFANKLLVQIDNVPIYTPLNSGVFWDREPVMLEDIERIEVIRGPGGTIWGNNAVNGIINIVTKSSQDTKGIYADVGGGSEHRQFSSARAGGQRGDVTYRVWGSNVVDDHGYVPPPQTPFDGYQYAQGGFRVDWTPGCRDTITLQGDLVNGMEGLREPWDQRFQKTMFLTRWTRKIDEDTDWQAQCSYYNPYGRGSFAALETTANFDFDFQYHAKRGRHDFVCGGGYRNENEAFALALLPLRYHDSEQIPSYFVQDTITLVDDRLFATLGSKFDHNSVTYFEYQPTVKLAWTPNERTSLWGAITRAVRTPSLLERQYDYGLRSEDMMAYEVGCRRQPNDKLFWELAVFYNRYDKLIGSLSPPILPYENVGHGETYGFEYDATYEVNRRWHLTGSYSFVIEYVDYPAGYSSNLPAGATPRNQSYLQSGWDLGRDVTLDVMFRYVDSLAAGVDKYFVGDV